MSSLSPWDPELAMLARLGTVLIHWVLVYERVGGTLKRLDIGFGGFSLDSNSIWCRSPALWETALSCPGKYPSHVFSLSKTIKKLLNRSRYSLLSFFHSILSYCIGYMFWCVVSVYQYQNNLIKTDGILYLHWQWRLIRYPRAICGGSVGKATRSRRAKVAWLHFNSPECPSLLIQLPALVSHNWTCEKQTNKELSSINIQLCFPIRAERGGDMTARKPL